MSAADAIESGGLVPALAASAINHSYGTRKVLQNVSLGAETGELLAILGPNGAGKTTLLRILAGAIKPATGMVELFGRSLESFQRRELARRIAFVAQENSVAFPFTALEIVLMGRAPRLGRMQFESAVDLDIARAALRRFGLEELSGRYIQELSGGERKRVFLARALTQEPAVTLLAEPSAFLDVKHAANIFVLLQELREERGLTVIVTMHDLNAAARYADRVMLLEGGAVVALGRPEEVLTRENLEAVFQTDLWVGRNPATGAVSVLPGDGRRLPRRP